MTLLSEKVAESQFTGLPDWHVANLLNEPDFSLPMITTATTVFAVGYSRPQTTFPFLGSIYAILAIGDIIGSPNYLLAEGWMAWEYGVQSLLGANHPYANRPPLIGD